MSAEDNQTSEGNAEHLLYFFLALTRKAIVKITFYASTAKYRGCGCSKFCDL